ncbi:MAG: DUF2442 domain-containing protein [Gemmatimonadaceae bacterium]|jgi:hypothetical protein|nr:DUF2442 domain-containing protein [Gemmatimonadaceae bacterium]
MLHLASARVTRPLRFWLIFNDGTAGEVDLHDALDGPVFEPLRDVQAFQSAFVDPEFGAPAWSNSVDIAPEFSHNGLAGRATRGE